MAAFLDVDAIVEQVKSGRIFVNCGKVSGHDIVLSVSADNTKVTGGATFRPGQLVSATIEGNRILKLNPGWSSMSR